MVMPVLAILAKDYADYSIILVGIAIGGYGLTQAILQIPMGMLSDRFGRKPIIVAGLVVFCLGSVVAALADSMLMLVVGRLLQGAGAIAGAIMALASDVSRQNQRAKVMAIIGIAIGFSFYLAVLLGPIIASYAGLQGIFMVTAVFASLCVPLVWWLVPNPTQVAPSGDTLPVLSDIGRLFKDSQLARLNLSVCLLHMLITLMFVQLPPLFIQSGVPLNDHWSLYLPVLICSIIGLSVLMGLNRKVSVKALMLVSLALLIAAFVGLLNAQTSLMLAAFLVVFFTGFNYLEANLPALVSTLAPAGKKGSAMGMYASFQFFGAFAGGILSGVLNQYFSAQLVFAVAIAICVVWLLLLLGLKPLGGLKRYSLSLENADTNIDVINQQLTELDGVEDIKLVKEQNVVYLKVNSNEFELARAHKIIGQMH